jgi:hypothetical protein
MTLSRVHDHCLAAGQYGGGPLDGDVVLAGIGNARAPEVGRRVESRKQQQVVHRQTHRHGLGLHPPQRVTHLVGHRFDAAPGRLRIAFETEMVVAAGVDAYWEDFFGGEDVFYGHVLGFKGLERPVIVLAVK